MRHKNILQFNLLWCTQWNVLQTMKCMTGLHAVFSWAGIPGGHFAAREDGPVEQNRVCLPGERWPVVSLVPSTAHVLPDGKSPQSSLTAQTQNIFVIDFHSKSARVNLVYNHDFFCLFFRLLRSCSGWTTTRWWRMTSRLGQPAEWCLPGI